MPVVEVRPGRARRMSGGSGDDFDRGVAGFLYYIDRYIFLYCAISFTSTHWACWNFSQTGSSDFNDARKYSDLAFNSFTHETYPNSIGLPGTP